ncbi:hypothetical protein BC833DRAFT_621806 [Globomyces pollinis-pini]|nr:hypothetical protein BC833DRAFT_621806 [Globomyces pollinis-pini]
MVFATEDTLAYDGYKLQYDCTKKTADRWSYSLDKTNKGYAKRPRSYYYDPSYPKECQQKSLRSYGRGYNRGHLVASSHMDYSVHSRHEAHYITNILPQVIQFNGGIWQHTESMTACQRQFNNVTVYGGVIYNDDSNDLFVESHGVRTPDLWWKVLLTVDNRGNDKIISWLIPNDFKLGPLEEYLVSVKDIERQLNDNLGLIPVSESLKRFKATMNWPRCSSFSFNIQKD